MSVMCSDSQWSHGLSVLSLPWNRSKELPSIGIPTLTIGAEYYIMDPAYMDWMATQFPNGSYLYCPDAGHMAMWDDPEGYHKGLADFINKV